MSQKQAEKYSGAARDSLDHVIRLEASTATVAEAADSIGCGAGHDSQDHVLSAG